MIERIQGWLNDWLRSWGYYYLAYIVTAIIAIASSISIHEEFSYREDSYITARLATAVIFAGCWMLPLAISQGLSLQVKYSDRKWRISLLIDVLILIAGTGFGIYTYSFIASYDNTDSQATIIVMLLLLAWIALPTTMTYYYRTNLLAWKGRGNIIFAYLKGSLSTGLLWGGLAATLASVEYLFDVWISGETYAQLGVACFVIGMSIMISSLNNNEHNDETTSENGFFGKYIFFPLTVVYAVILVIYALKILISGVRPQGLVAYMVIGYTAWGFMAYFMTYHLATRSTTIAKIQQGFFISLLLVVFLLFGSIGIRIAHYGWTPNRIFVVLFGIWIIISGIAGLIGRKQYLTTITSAFLGLIIIGFCSFPITKHLHQQSIITNFQSLGWLDANGTLNTDLKEAKNLDTDQKTMLRQIYASLDHLSDYYGYEATLKRAQTILKLQEEPVSLIDLFNLAGLDDYSFISSSYDDYLRQHDNQRRSFYNNVDSSGIDISKHKIMIYLSYSYNKDQKYYQGEDEVKDTIITPQGNIIISYNYNSPITIQTPSKTFEINPLELADYYYNQSLLEQREPLFVSDDYTLVMRYVNGDIIRGTSDDNTIIHNGFSIEGHLLLP